MSTDQTSAVRYPVARRGKRHLVRRWVVTFFTVIVILVVFVIGDRLANAVAENSIASQLQSSGFPAATGVTITGVPFLTQVVTGDVHRIDITATNVPAGPVQLSTFTAVATGVDLNWAFNGGTVDQISANALVTFDQVANAATNGAGGAGLTLAADGGDKIKVTAGTGQLSASEVAQVSQTGRSQVNVQVLGNGGAPGSTLNSFGSFSFDVPKLPAGLRITRVFVTAQGIAITASAHNTQLGA
jgi:hypothetical protein